MSERKFEKLEFVPPPVDGGIEVICGGMFSGKSEELIRRARRAVIARQEVVIFKPALDNRRGESTVNSYNGNSMEAISVGSADYVWGVLESRERRPTVVAFDEAQFFDKQLLDVANRLADEGVRVIIAGLNTDFRGEPFGVMADLIPIADQIDTLHAICVECGEDASRTQRMIKERTNGSDWSEPRPAFYDDPILLVGGAQDETNVEVREIVEFYEARCRKHHRVPKREQNS